MREDHVDRFLRELAVLPPEVDIDLDVEALVDRIHSISRRIRRAMEATLAEYGLSHAEWDVLVQLRLAPPPHVSSPGALAEHCDLSSGGMTSRLDRLEQAGLVRRLPDPDDRRGVVVQLTDEGRDAWDAAASVQGRKEAFFASALTKAELGRLIDLLRKLLLALEDRADASHTARVAG